MNVRVLSADDIRSAISMAEAIEAVAAGFAQLSLGSASAPLRTSLGSSGGTSLFMPAYLPDSETTALKIVSVCSENSLQGLPTIIAIVAVLDGRTGSPLA
jgi:ornithine cyclodeaminase